MASGDRAIRVAGGDLDDDYLDRWAFELGVVDLLVRARDEARGELQVAGALVGKIAPGRFSGRLRRCSA